MKIKIIDLLNKIAKRKDIPELIEYKEERYCWVEGKYGGYRNKGLYWFCNQHANYDEPDFLNDEVEIIEEDKTIKELELVNEGERKIKGITGQEYTMRVIDCIFADKINELVKEINKLKENK